MNDFVINQIMQRREAESKEKGKALLGLGSVFLGRYKDKKSVQLSYASEWLSETKKYLLNNTPEEASLYEILFEIEELVLKGNAKVALKRKEASALLNEPMTFGSRIGAYGAPGQPHVEEDMVL